MKSITTLLVANRGEIAVRVMRTAREMGLGTVAVHSDADESAPHVRIADRAVRLGPGPVAQSYLRGDRIIQAALDTGAEAIHPGYGLLSENAQFAQAVADAGLIFVGPSPQAIELMGDKALAKRRMLASDVPCIPGYEGDDQGEARFIAAAQEIGYPVMVKAAAGGGGRGMRLVHDADALPGALELASAEAKNAFGSSDLILEKAITAPRHVEVQVFGDAHGNTIYLGERDCSVQRRHQKIIEEAPCPVMTPELRAAMGEAAVNAARAVDYRGAGTVEFLLDAAGEFYFLEMNTRLQVEHPVTEFITGLDLVALQLRVAQGEPLGIEQSEVSLTGHAMEVRLYAEDPARGFLPRTGSVLRWSPATGEGVRVDAGIATGDEVSPFYDSMLAKVIAYGSDRDESRRRLVRALEDTALFGVTSNRDFLIDALRQPGFADGSATTAFIDEAYGAAGYQAPALTFQVQAVAAVVQYCLAQGRALRETVSVSAELLDWSSDGNSTAVREYAHADGNLIVRVTPGEPAHTYFVSGGEDVLEIAVRSKEAEAMTLVVAGEAVRVCYLEESPQVLHLAVGGESHCLVDVSGGAASEESAAGDGLIRAPMHGLLLNISVAEGDSVKRGDKLAVLEAMKMQHEILADVAGTVSELAAAENAQIGADELILRIDPT